MRSRTFETALIALTSIAAANSASADPLLDGIRHFQAGDHAAAMVEFKVAALDQPNNGEARYYLGAALLQLERPLEAYAALSRGLFQSPELADHLASHYLGMAAYAVRAHLVASRHFAAAISHAPSSKLVQTARARVDAIAALHASAPERGVAAWYHERGLERLVEAKPWEAEPYLSECVAIWQRWPAAAKDVGPPAALALAGALNTTGRPAGALALLEGLRVPGRAPELALQTGRALLAIGESERARRHLEIAARATGTVGRAAAALLSGFRPGKPAAHR